MIKFVSFYGLISLILLCSLPQNVFSQNDSGVECKVLISELSESYQGSCKNGLAHGKGVAKGTDVYEGRFKKGLPHGQGKYTWSNGSYYDGTWKEGKREGKGMMYDANEEKKTFGSWKNDAFAKELEVRPYEILQRMGITGYNFIEKQNSSPGSIEIVFVRDGVEHKMFQDLMIDASSGFVKTSYRYCGVDNVFYPVEIGVEFTAPNRFQTGTINYEFKFKIIKESSWKVVLRY